MQHLKEKLSEWREERGMSIKHFLAKVGMSRSRYDMIMRYGGRPGVAMAKSIEEFTEGAFTIDELRREE